MRWAFLVAGVALLTLANGDSEFAGAVIIASTALYGFAMAATGLVIARRRPVPAARPATMRLPEAAR